MGLPASVQQYHDIAELTLKPLIQQNYKELTALQTEHDELSALKEQLQQFADAHERPVHTITDIGEGFFMQARIDDTSAICVHVGAGVHVELSLAEAQAYVAKRVALLQSVEGKRERLVELETDMLIARAALATLASSDSE